MAEPAPSSPPAPSPVADWATDFDILDEGYIADPFSVWEELRGGCPIAHSDRRESTFLPTKYEDVQAFAKMVPELSSADPLVVAAPEAIRQTEHFKKYGANSPPH